MFRSVQLLRSFFLILITTVVHTIQFLRLALSSRAALSAEVLFLRKQLVFYQEHQIAPRKLTASARFSLVLWSRFFHWRAALMIVQPEPSWVGMVRDASCGGGGSRGGEGLGFRRSFAS